MNAKSINRRVGVPAGGDDTARKKAGPRADQRALWRDWGRLWNGDYAQADRIISPRFEVHTALLDGSSDDAIRGPEGLTRWIKQSRAPFSADYRFTTEVGPLIDGRYVTGRWKATGTYEGGFPGAAAEPGTVVGFTGTDILRVKDGKIVEYWLNADGALLLQQLGVQPQQ